MRNLNNFLPSSLVAGGPAALRKPGALGQQQGALTLISKDLPWTRGPASVGEPSFGLPGPFPAVKKVKRTRKLWPWTSSQSEKTSVFSSPTFTQEWAGLGFQAQRLNLWINLFSASTEHFCGVLCSLRSLQRSWGPSRYFTKTFHTHPSKVLCPPPSPKGISAGLLKTGLEVIFGLGTDWLASSQCPRPNNNPF